MTRRLIAIGFVVACGVAVAALAWRPVLAPIAQPPEFDHALIAKGAELVAIGDCAVCHAGRDGQAYAGGLPLATPFGQIYGSNITPDPETGIGTWSEAAFRRAMHDGVDRAGHFLYPAFPYDHFAHVADDDVAAIYAFLMTRAPVRTETPATHLPFPFNIRRLMAGWNLLFLRRAPLLPDPAKPADWNRGRYLVEGLGHCQACHTPHNAFGAEDASKAFAGSLVDGWEAPGLTATTSPAAIAWTADALYRYLQHGIDAEHTAVAGPMEPVSHDLSVVPEADVRAIALYLASMTGVPDPTRQQRVVARAAAALTPPAALAETDGAKIFAGACAGCHSAGAPMMLDGRPSLALGSAVTAPTARNATQVILFGLQPPAGEPGPWMPGFADSLTDSQVVALLGYLRARFTDRPAWVATDQDVQQIRQDKRS
jgi:mono/diheme cytochrome c family protein